MPFRILYDSVVSRLFFDRVVKMINLLNLILINSVLLTELVESGHIYDDLAKFCSNNGMVFLSLTTTTENPIIRYEANLAFMAFRNNDLRIRRLSFDKLQVWFSQSY